MNRKIGTGLILTLAALLTPVLSCDPAMLLPLIPAPFSFTPELSAFELEANVAKRNTGTIRVTQSEFTISRGTIELDLTKLTTELTLLQKGTVNAQVSQSLTVTAWADAPGALDTVCTSGDQYGPYTIAFDENLVPISVSPQDLELTAKTTGLLNEGEISFCLEVVSTFDGSVTIGGIILNLGGLPNF